VLQPQLAAAEDAPVALDDAVALARPQGLPRYDSGSKFTVSGPISTPIVSLMARRSSGV